MDASTRLYTRLGEIPEDPDNPESLDDLLVCAFGAFERYYVCWKTRGGEYRQDGYDLPSALKDWLYPTDGTTRDFSTLQVVFGRGEEYFASDKYGKLEYKEPESKKQIEDEEKIERQSLRRSRTVSFLRPLSETSVRSDGSVMESIASRRSSSISSQRASRPPSLSYSRTNSDASATFQNFTQPHNTQSSRTNSQSSFPSQWGSFGSNAADSDLPTSPAKVNDRLSRTSLIVGLQDKGTLRGLSEEPAAQNYLNDVSGEDQSTKVAGNRPGLDGSLITTKRSVSSGVASSCTCKCHDCQVRSSSKSSYVDVGVQTDPSPAPRPDLQIDTSSSNWGSHQGYIAVSQQVETPVLDDNQSTNPVFMGRMMDYFSKPGYQLGDSLMSGYQTYQPLIYQYQDEFGEEALR